MAESKQQAPERAAKKTDVAVASQTGGKPEGEDEAENESRLAWIMGWVVGPGVVLGTLFGGGVLVGAHFHDGWIARAIVWIFSWF